MTPSTIATNLDRLGTPHAIMPLLVTNKSMRHFVKQDVFDLLHGNVGIGDHVHGQGDHMLDKVTTTSSLDRPIKLEAPLVQAVLLEELLGTRVDILSARHHDE